MNSNKPIIVVAGPTASGKSFFSMQLAKLINGTIVNFDSMQVYNDLKILTARPNAIDLEIVPHKLYGFLSGGVRCTALYWRNHALKEIEKIFISGRVPILVGGTGLYIKTLMDGITDIPESMSFFNKQAHNLLNKVGDKSFYNIVKKIDPEIVKNISLKDHQRLLRAYTVWLQTKKPLTEWQKSDSMNKKVYNNFLKIRLTPERKLLRNNIKKRFIDMINYGVIEEVKKFKKYDISLPIMKAHGLREILAYLEGDKSIDKVIEETVNQINQYAKRQDTWFRNKYFSDYNIVDSKNNIDDNCSNILSLYSELYK